jgi:transketolase
MQNNLEVSRLQMRDAFINKLYERACSDKNIIFISNEMGSESLDKFRNDLPAQFINAGISEQNIISLAAGMAIEGKRVYVYSIASFITLRCLEQIKIDICTMKLPVTIIGVGASYSYSADGPTHHATEDISILRPMAGMGIYCPADSVIAERLVDISLNSTTPIYLRFDRDKLPVFYTIAEDISRGNKVIHKGTDVCIISTGIMTHIAYATAVELARNNISVKVVDLFRIKPLNSEELIEEVRNFRNIITLEEHSLQGGIGSIISEILHDNCLNINLHRMGIQEENIYTYNLRKDIHIKNKIDYGSLSMFIRKLLNKFI